MQQGDLSPAQLRHVFGANLRELSQSAPSISQLCRDLGMNRTQFNRYLNGEAFPRPDVLYRICTHFNVDARILLEPLAGIPTGDEDSVGTRHLARLLQKVGALNIDPEVLPDGVYLHYRLSYFVNAAISCSLMRLVRDEAGILRVKGYLARTASDRLGFGRAAAMRRYHGIIFRQMMGYSVVAAMDNVPMMVLTGIEANYLGNPNFYFGSTIATQDVMSPSPLLMERLDTTFEAMMAARSQIGVFPRAHYSALVRGFFDKYAPLD